MTLAWQHAATGQTPQAQGPPGVAVHHPTRRPATNNGSETPIRGFKLAPNGQGGGRPLATLQRHCRIRTYLVSARNHGRRPIDAIRDALIAKPWMPLQTA